MTKEQHNINVIIVDDEKKACTNLVTILHDFVDASINICDVVNSTAQAEISIHKFAPDAVFLDIEMPNENAFQFLERISPFNFEVIFVTAFDEYAIRAFKLNALDYILKPISIIELRNAVEKLKNKVKYKNILAQNGISFMELSDLVTNKTRQHRITLKDGVTTEVVDFRDILFVEAQSSYSKILFLKGGEIREMVMSYPLSEYEGLLPAEHFFRIHRSFLINCRHLKKLLNDNQVIIHDQFTLPVGRRRYLSLLAFLKHNDYYDV